MIVDQEETQSVEERLANILAMEDTVDPEEVEPQAAEEAEEEQEETESEEEETEEPVKLKLKRGEEEVEVDLDEAKDLAQKGYDYTKKTQEVAELRKQTEMYAQAVKAQEQALQQQAALQQAFIKDIAKIEAINDQIGQYEQLDWNALSDQDPVQTQKLWIQYQNLQNQRAQAHNEMNQKQQHLHQQRYQQEQMALEQARAELLKAMPDFNADKAKAIRESAKDYGFTDTELSSVKDPRYVRVLADAIAYRKLQAEKASVTKKVSDKPPVVKPGAKDNNAATKTANKQLRENLRKSGRHEDAAAIIERML